MEGRADAAVFGAGLAVHQGGGRKPAAELTRSRLQLGVTQAVKLACAAIAPSTRAVAAVAPDGAAAGLAEAVQAELVAGDDGAAEFGLFDGAEQDGDAAGRAEFVGDQDAGGLRQGFDDQHAGHDRAGGQIVLEEWFVAGDVLDAGAGAAGYDLDDAVDEQEGVAVCGRSCLICSSPMV